MNVCVLYVNFWSKVRPRTVGCIAMGSVVLFILRYRLLLYSAGSKMNRVQVVLSGFSVTLFKYDLRKGDLLVLSWASVQQVRRGSVSSDLLMCGGAHSILLLPLVARCLEKIDVCIWRMFVFMSVVVTVWGFVGMFVV